MKNTFGKYEKRLLAILGVIFVIFEVAGCQLSHGSNFSRAIRKTSAHEVAGSQSSHNPDFARTIRKTSAYIESQMHKDKAVGLSIALVSGNKVVWAQGFGWADKGHKIPATANSVYMLGSGTKTLTTVAILKLCQQGVVSLDKPVVAYLPDFSMADRYPNQLRGITLRRLLDNHSGIPGDLYNGGFIVGKSWDSWGGNLDRTLYMNWLLRYLSTDYPSHPPGEIASYCNTGFVLAGEIALKMDGHAGESYPEYMSRVLFTPLGMNHTSLLAIRDNLARGYIGGKVQAVKQCNGPFGATGGAFTTVKDMARFLMMIINAGKAPDGSIYLKPGTVAMLGTGDRSPLDIDSFFQTGLGLDSASDPVMQYAGRAWAKNGSTGDYNSLMEMLPDAKLAVIVLTNSDTGKDLVWGVVRECLKNAVRDKLKLQPSPPDLPTYVSVANPSRIAGIYVKKHGYDKVVSNGNSTFTWTINAQQKNPKTYTLTRRGGVYRAEGRSESISFKNIPWKGRDHFVMIQSGSNGSGRDEYTYGGYVRSMLGEKITVPPLRAAWKARQGIYVLDNVPWDDATTWPSPFFLLTVKDGMLVLNEETVAIAKNDSTAFVPGLTNRSDSSIRVIRQDGMEKLLFGGYRGYKIGLVPTVSSGQTVSGKVGLFKTDWYRFDTVTPGQRVTFSVTTDSDQYALTLFDRNDTFMSRKMGTLSFTAKKGPYYIAVSPTLRADGNYTMRVN